MLLALGLPDITSILYLNLKIGDLSGGPVINMLCSHYRGHRFNPWLGMIPCAVAQLKKNHKLESRSLVRPNFFAKNFNSTRIKNVRTLRCIFECLVAGISPTVKQLQCKCSPRDYSANSTKASLDIAAVQSLSGV